MTDNLMLGGEDFSPDMLAPEGDRIFEALKDGETVEPDEAVEADGTSELEAAEKSEEEARGDGKLLSKLEGELEHLREQLAQSEEKARRTAEGWRELCELFPDADISLMPESFERAIESGVPPAAAYALELRRQQRLTEQIEMANNRGRRNSAGRAGAVDDSLYSPDEVRAMTQSEVRANYEKIRLSMKSW